MSRWLLIAMTVLSLAGCSGMRLGYNHLDKLVAYRLNDWFALSGDASGELEALARERFARVQAWNRKDELPAYANMARTLRARLAEPAPLTLQEVESLQRQVTGRFLRIGEEVATQFADVLARMGPAQRARLLARMDESNDEYRKRRIDGRPAKLRQQRIEDATGRFEFWLGKLGRAQRERIERWVDALDTDARLNLAQRQRRQQAFLAILDAAKSAPTADTARRLRLFFADLETPADPAAKMRQQAMLERWAQLTADLLNEASAEQRKHARDRLQAMSDDFVSLSR